MTARRPVLINQLITWFQTLIEVFICYMRMLCLLVTIRRSPDIKNDINNNNNNNNNKNDNNSTNNNNGLNHE